ncbi:hypothetical protein WH47_11344 [Habropoda laboriosa]|uniref:Uncharacterized protein n=1 Tax=Habropoda laboriosa TaxID=597456 RepID=A0A0L7QLV1_9HYME|nr:hypothetical protein WH47_11344 [Habropoda laboriosa]
MREPSRFVSLFSAGAAFRGKVETTHRQKRCHPEQSVEMKSTCSLARNYVEKVAVQRTSRVKRKRFANDKKEIRSASQIRDVHGEQLCSPLRLKNVSGCFPF